MSTGNFRFAGLAALRLLPTVLAVLLSLTATAFAQITVTDVTGRTVTLEKPAHRLLVDDGRYLIALSLLHPDPVSLLTAWPKDINRIGPAVYRRYVEKFPDIEKLHQVASSAQQFSVEQVLAAEPDLAVFSLNSKPSDAEIATIEAAGIPVVVIDFFNDPLDNLEPGLRLLAAVVGRSQQAEEFIAFRRARMDAVTARLASAKTRPTVFFEAHAARTADCCASPGNGNIGKYIAFAGGENIGSAVIKGPVGTLNLEYVIETDPDVYIVSGGPQMEGTNGLLIGPGYEESVIRQTLERVVSRRGISELKAVAQGHVHGLAHQLLNSPLDILTVQALARWIYPELFGDLDLDATRREINERFLAVPLDGISWIDLK